MYVLMDKFFKIIMVSLAPLKPIALIRLLQIDFAQMDFKCSKPKEGSDRLVVADLFSKHQGVIDMPRGDFL